MTTTARPVTAPAKTWTWRSVVFSILASAVGLLLISGQLADLLVPWLSHAQVHDSTVAVPVMHLWHYAQRGMHSLILLALPVLVVAWRPRQCVLMMQFLLLSAGLLAAFIFPVRPADSMVLGVGLGVLVAAFPGPRRLAERPLLDELSRPLLGLTLVCSPFMLAEAARLVQWQMLGVGGEHASAGHWIAAATIPLALLVAGLGAATRSPGARTLGMIAGLGYLYLGAAAIALRGYDGSWGTRGGAASLVVGAAYLGLTLWQAQRRAQHATRDQR